MAAKLLSLLLMVGVVLFFAGEKKFNSTSNVEEWDYRELLEAKDKLTISITSW